MHKNIISDAIKIICWPSAAVVQTHQNQHLAKQQGKYINITPTNHSIEGTVEIIPVSRFRSNGYSLCSRAWIWLREGWAGKVPTQSPCSHCPLLARP